MSDNKITLKNTKSEILNALDAALKRAETAEMGKLNPEKEEKTKIEKKAVESAKKSIEQNIFSKELNDKFNDLQIAITTEETRLKELYEVGQELQKLALVIEAGKDCIAKIEIEKSEKETDMRKNLENLNNEFAEKNNNLKFEHDSYMKALKMERTRENEEFQYNLKRTRGKEDNLWEDKKSERESELSKRENIAKDLLSDAESKIEYIKELEEKVTNIPQLLQSERETCEELLTEKLKKEHEYASTLAEKDYQSTIKLLEDKISFLEKELDFSGKTVKELQNKLDKAYTEMRELATKTVESASGFKIIGNTDNKNS